MPEPKLSRDGNLRFAGLSSAGYPADADALHADVLAALAGSQAKPYGALTLWFSLPPEDTPPAQWDCQVGTAITGLPPGGTNLLVEDYRNLLALSLPHAGAVREIPLTWRRLVDHAKRMTLGTVRPYWRLALRRRRMPDGNPLPVAEVAIFLDR